MQLNIFVPSMSLKFALLLIGSVLAVLTSTTSNNQLQLSPTVLLPGDNTIYTAVGNQTAPQIAGGANGFLVVWQDNRSQIYDAPIIDTCGFWRGSGAGTNNDIYAARMDANGQLVDTTPIILSQSPTCQSRPGVAWNGQNWLVVWTSQKDDPFEVVLEGVRVAPSGQVLDQTPILISRQASFSLYSQLTSDGNNWTVIWSGGRGVSGVQVSADGTVDATGAKLLYLYPDPLPPTVNVHADIAFAGDEYLLVWSEVVYINVNQVTSTLKAQRLNRALYPLSNVFTLRHAGASKPSVATDGQNFLVAMNSLGWLVERGTQVVSDQLILAVDGAVEDVCWDGANYFIAGFKEHYTIFAAKIAPNGVPVGNNGVELKRNDRNLLVAVAPRPNGGAQVVWMTQNVYQPYADASASYISPDQDVLTAGLTTNEMATPVTPVGVSAPRQSLAQMTAGSDGFLLAYRSQFSGDSRIMAIKLDSGGNPVSTEPIRLDGGYPAITNPAVVWNGTSYMVVWENSEEPAGGFTSQQGTIYGRRLGADGEPLDASPFRISKGKNADVAVLNGEFLVVSSFQFDGSVVATRISESGQIFQSSTILHSAIGLSGSFSRPSLATVGDRWLMVWTGTDSSGCNCVWGAFISQQGTVGNAFKISGPLGDCQTISWGLDPQVASAGDSALVIYRGRTTPGFAQDLDLFGGITARRVKADGTFDNETLRGFSVSSNGYVPSVAWDGSGFLAAWLDPRNALYPRQSSGDIFAARINNTGAVLDLTGIALADSDSPEDKPTVTAHNGIAIFAWSGIARQPSSVTMRIHLRTMRNAFFLPPVTPQIFSYSWNWNTSTLTWGDNSSNEDGFKIERCQGANCSNFAEIARVPANTVQYNESGLLPQIWYRYRVRAFNAVGDSEFTAPIQLQTDAAPSFTITGRLTDRDGRGLENFGVTLSGSQGSFARTDRSGYYRLSGVSGGGNYRVTVQSPGPRSGFTTYYPNPGWVEFNYLLSNQSANFIYNLTSPWVPPGTTPTPTPLSTPTPTPTPPPTGNDGTILNPGFDQGGTNWATSGAVSFANGTARLTPTTNFSPASIIQWVLLTAGATYEVSADITATSTTRLTFGVKFDENGNIPAGPSVPFTNIARPTNIRLRFTLPSGVSKVGFSTIAHGSVSSGSLATIDNFRLSRVN